LYKPKITAKVWKTAKSTIVHAQIEKSSHTIFFTKHPHQDVMFCKEDRCGWSALAIPPVKTGGFKACPALRE
jgi:hypothetical protein